MTLRPECRQNRDPLKLVREGTGQAERALVGLAPSYAPADGRGIADDMVFARAYSTFLSFFNANNVPDGDWQPFFGTDLSLLLAVAAIQDVELYRVRVKEFLDFLRDLDFGSDEALARVNLGYLFSCAGTVALALDQLKEKLPPDISLKGTLAGLVRGRLAPSFRRLLSYYKADLALPEADRLIADVEPDLPVFGVGTIPFSRIFQAGFSGDWITDASTDWPGYLAAIAPDASVYGSGIEVFQRINHIATHNLFTSILDQFLKAYARTAADGQRELEKSLTDRDDHQPHYALFLAFLRLMAYAREGANTLTGRHLDFYYRDILRLKEKEARPSQAHLLVELARQAEDHLLKEGELFRAGKDDLGREAFFANDRDMVPNQGKVVELKTLYRHGKEKVGLAAPTDIHRDRLFASPVANSGDGRGGELLSEDKSWHPLHNKTYRDGMLATIEMPKAEVGFAVAAHHLHLAGGERKIEVTFNGASPKGDFQNEVLCLLTGAKGWIEKPPASFAAGKDGLVLEIVLAGADPAVVGYSPELHGYGFETSLPVLLVKLLHRDTGYFAFPRLEDATVSGIELSIEVKKLRKAAFSNDFGPVDPSKPFQPFGASPAKNASFVIGSRELFQKTLTSASLDVEWQNPPAPFGGKAVTVVTEYLQGGNWQSYKSSLQADVTATTFTLLGEPQSPDAPPFTDAPDSGDDEQFQASARYGFVRLRLSDDFGQGSYEQALIDYIKRVTDDDPENDGTRPAPPTGPFIAGVTIDYAAQQKLPLDSTDEKGFAERPAKFFHLAPFGHAEQHPRLKRNVPGADATIFLLPQMRHANRDDAKLPIGHPVKHEAEFYIGLSDLVPPRNLALLFQVADGSADPRSLKPVPHLQWSYLKGNEWIPFAKEELEDRTAGLIDSGIVTFKIPRGASNDNTVLPAGMHWIRGAVSSQSDSVCRLILVAAQALKATFIDRDNDPAFAGKPLPAGTIAKLAEPVAEVKKIEQPLASFGGRCKETPPAFYIRVSERLRHKDRAIAQWDYERLVLEAFPEIYRVKCLNHTHYEPDETGTGIYRELAPGHVTVIAIPNLEGLNLRDPLRPYTSLALLDKIAAFLGRRLSCFVKLHVKNPEFEEVQVACKIRLHEGLDETFFGKRIDEDLRRFLSPWAFPGGGTPSFGGKVRKSVLIDFLEELPFIDCVTELKLMHSFQGPGGATVTVEVEEAAGSKAVSVLVSARKHLISIIAPAEAASPAEICRCVA